MFLDEGIQWFSSTWRSQPPRRSVPMSGRSLPPVTRPTAASFPSIHLFLVYFWIARLLGGERQVSRLAGRPSMAAGRAGPAVAIGLPFDAAHLRALVIGSAELGEIVMRAILRRVALIEAGDFGSVLIGRPSTPERVRLEGFLTRNGYPVTVLDATPDGEGRDLSGLACETTNRP
jgi:hypothetical protein